MRVKALCASLLAGAVLSGTLLTPVTVSAQSWRDRESHRRQQTKNEWRNIAIGAGALGIIGLLRHDNTLTFAGTAGALYSAWRYEQDRKSQSKIDRARAAYFSRPYFYRNGKRYVRKTVWRNGHKYYRFVRG
ncbi:MAG TPA: hypothetical protein VFB21_24440 [Chthonomonadaceae bacterium]|jgi:hypothetical protein|nr:hypothetical protein [Chthonomonadaceae bacterium]